MYVLHIKSLLPNTDCIGRTKSDSLVFVEDIDQNLIHLCLGCYIMAMVLILYKINSNIKESY